jgi:hypothetical protein
MEDQMENNVRRLERLGRYLTGAAAALAIAIVLLVIIDFA